LVLFLVLVPTLGSVRDDAETAAIRLQNELSSIQQNLRQSKEDFDFIAANQNRFESLMASDKLIPHTRRTAIRQMQSVAVDAGLTALNYNFQAAANLAPEAASSQPKNDLYRVNVENVELTLGAPIDQSFYSFIASVYEQFPGSMAITEVEIERSPGVTTEALNLVSRGEDSGLVKGKLKYSWRTAQQNKQEEKK